MTIITIKDLYYCYDDDYEYGKILVDETNDISFEKKIEKIQKKAENGIEFQDLLDYINANFNVIESKCVEVYI